MLYIKLFTMFFFKNFIVFFVLLLYINGFSQNTISTRFVVPKNFVRQLNAKDSFGYFLQHLPLKPADEKVKYFNGNKKPNTAYIAVIDLNIGEKDLHQCADAIMRLRGDFFYKNQNFNKIHFNFTNGFRVDFSKWIQGYRIILRGNKTSWVKTAKPSSDYRTYWKYMEQIFQYAGTASLEKELQKINVKNLNIGDVFIKGGFPGHAIIVVDVAENRNTGAKIFMLAQSYMPAQELQILRNNKNQSISPWYDLDFGKELVTPEWTFLPSQLKRFTE